MSNQTKNGNAALLETMTNHLNTVNRCTYEKTNNDALTELISHQQQLLQLTEDHPNNPAIAALSREYMPYIVCGADYLFKQTLRANTADTAEHQKLELLLTLFDAWRTGWLKAYLPADTKLPDAFVVRECPQLRLAYDAVDNAFTAGKFTLPAAMALEVVLVLLQAPAGQVITWGQWQYAQQLVTEIQQLFNNAATPVTEEQVINTLLALRCNTGQFCIWYTAYLKDTIQEAGSTAEKKSA